MKERYTLKRAIGNAERSVELRMEGRLEEAVAHLTSAVAVLIDYLRYREAEK